MAEQTTDAANAATHPAWHLQREFALSASDVEILANVSPSPTRRRRALDLGKASNGEEPDVVSPQPDGEARPDPQGER